MHSGPRILIGITGGIAAYKVPQLIRLLTGRGADVKVVCTPGSLRFVGHETLRTLTGHPVYRDDVSQHDIDHIRLAEWADLFLIAPATANTIAKMAHGIADNLLTTLALSIQPKKITVAPAMNTVMWKNSTTQANVSALLKTGMTILPVGEGDLACGTSGPGRMLEPHEMVEIVLRTLTPHGPLAGKLVLISSGPTEEPLDPVRVITNRSSGRMGAALASAALLQGAEVVVVSGPARFPLPSGARVVKVTTAREISDVLVREFKAADVCIMAAAVSDFKPVNTQKEKIRRQAGKEINLRLESNPDIAALLGKKKADKLLVGFALEIGNDDASVRKKMKEKRCDVMVFNSVEESLGRDDTRISIFSGDGAVEQCPVMPKTEAANLIMQRIAARLG